MEKYKFEIGQKVVYKNIVGIIEHRNYYSDGNPHYGLISDEDNEMTCTAPENECVVYDGSEIDQSEALLEARLSSATITNQVARMTDKYFRDGCH